MVGAWAIGQHKEVNIGRFRNGKPDPSFWTRLAATLEPANVRPTTAPAGELPQTIIPPIARQPARRPRYQIMR